MGGRGGNKKIHGEAPPQSPTLHIPFFTVVIVCVLLRKNGLPLTCHRSDTASVIWIFHLNNPLKYLKESTVRAYARDVLKGLFKYLPANPLACQIKSQLFNPFVSLQLEKRTPFSWKPPCCYFWQELSFLITSITKLVESVKLTPGNTIFLQSPSELV